MQTLARAKSMPGNVIPNTEQKMASATANFHIESTKMLTL